MSQLRKAASSDLSAFCNSFYQAHPDFHYLDGDFVLFAHAALPMVYARATRILRLVESKRPGEDLTRSQREVLPILSALVEQGVREGTIAKRSGVFIVTGDGPAYPEGATVAKVRPDAPGAEWSSAGVQAETEKVLNREQLVTFMRCR